MSAKACRPSVRTWVRCFALLTGVLLLAGVLPWQAVVRAVPAASPFVAIATILASGVLGLSAICALPVLAVAIFRRRWFCRWGCPVGLMTECGGKISPSSSSRCKRLPSLGIWLVVLSLSGAVVGSPLFLWLDPLALFSGTVGLAMGEGTPAAYAAAAVLACVLGISFALPGAWCLKICPLGATQEVVARPGIWLGRGQRDAESVEDDDSTGSFMNRRRALATGIGGICALAGVSAGVAANRKRDRKADPLRPPGAAPEWQFGQLCLRCGNCARVCPSRIITSRWEVGTWSTWLAPEISFETDYCREDCSACLEVCPSGALRNRDDPANTKPVVGVALVEMNRCLLALGRECRTMCLDSCPYEAITLHEWSWEDDRRYPIVDPEKCPGCGACQVACTPMDAIVVRRESRSGQSV